MLKFLTLPFLLLISMSITAQKIDNFSNCELDSINGQKIYTIPEIAPQYEGGFQKFYSDLSSKIKITDKTSVGCVKVVLSFVVDIDGEIRNFCSTKNIGITNEFIESLNNWSAGLIGDEKVPVRMYVPMYIKLG